MNDKLLQKLATKLPTKVIDAPATSALADEPELIDNLGCYGWLRGAKERAVMLELRKRDGNILAIGYGWVERVEFDPSEGITLHIVAQKIHIRDRNLNAESRPHVRLFQGISWHRVPWIQEVDQSVAIQAGNHVTLVEAIEWQA